MARAKGTCPLGFDWVSHGATWGGQALLEPCTCGTKLACRFCGEAHVYQARCRACGSRLIPRTST